MTEEIIQESKDFIIANWGDAGEKVIAEASKVQPFGGNVKEFLDHCIACGGDWGAMFLSGVHALYPAVYNAIPENMGKSAFLCICYTLQLCGVNTAE